MTQDQKCGTAEIDNTLVDDKQRGQPLSHFSVANQDQSHQEVAHHTQSSQRNEQVGDPFMISLLLQRKYFFRKNIPDNILHHLDIGATLVNWCGELICFHDQKHKRNSSHFQQEVKTIYFLNSDMGSITLK